MPDVTNTAMYGINNAGLAVGYGAGTFTSPFPGTYNAAITWQNGVGYTNINVAIGNTLAPESSCSSEAFAVNNSGQTVGYYQPDMDSNYHAFLYNNSTNIVALGSLGGDGGDGAARTAPTPWPSTTTAASWAILRLAPTPPSTRSVWNPTNNNSASGTMVDLTTSSSILSRVPSGYYLYSATGINSSGSICGYTYNGQLGAAAEYRAFALIATLPGDANLDGKVDINDLTIVLATTARPARRGSRASSPGTARWTSTT